MMEGVMTNHITLAYTNWPQPWSSCLTLTMLIQTQMFILIWWLQNKRPVPVRDDENDKTIVWPTAGCLSTRTVTLNITVSLFWPYVVAMGFMAFCDMCPTCTAWTNKVFTPKDIDRATWQHDNDNSSVPTMGSHSSVKLLPYVTDYSLYAVKVFNRTPTLPSIDFVLTIQEYFKCIKWQNIYRSHVHPFCPSKTAETDSSLNLKPQNDH